MYTWGSQRTTCRSWLATSALWVLGIELSYRAQKCWKKIILVSHKETLRKKVTLARQVPAIKGDPWPETGIHRQEILCRTRLANWTKGSVWSSWGKSRHWVKGHFTRFGKFMECLLLAANYLWNSNNKKKSFPKIFIWWISTIGQTLQLDLHIYPLRWFSQCHIIE